MQILGIDNVFLQVKNLQDAETFYHNIGFELKLKLPHMKAVLFSIGDEEPGLLVIESDHNNKSRLWVEVRDALDVERELAERGIESELLQTGTGITCEVQDPWGNRIGFADYRLKPELARK
jgi:catechol-2,3-dioxygenase